MADTLSIEATGSPSDETCRLIDLAFSRALARKSAVSQDALSLSGMSGRCYRMFINNLVRLTHDPRYLEVGSWGGSTACAVMDKNVATVTCIDNWSQFGGPKQTFFDNTTKFTTVNVKFRFIESDFRAVDIGSIGKYNTYLFDGPHEEQDQYDGLALYKTALEDELVFIVDDWNWEEVRNGTFRAIREVGMAVDYCIQVRTTMDGTHASIHGESGDWHNGYFIGKLSRV